MRTILLACATMLLAVPAYGQGRPPGDGPPGAGPGGGPPGGRMSRPREMRPLDREDFDTAVTQVFVAADSDRNGMVTLDELRGVFRMRRETVIRERFDRIDANRSGQIDAAEFIAWQEELGSVASADTAMQADFGPVQESIRPELGDDPRDMMIARLIEPLGPLVLTNANTNYDSGMSLDEFLAYQRRRFDEADSDGDGRVSMNEMPRSDGPGGLDGPGFPPRGGRGPGIARS